MDINSIPPQLFQDAIDTRGTGDLRAITEITTSGFASYGRPQSVQIHPLTLLAGSNSAGKSSSIKPLLLLKQTLDHAIDPGSLLISGPNVQFSNLNQIFTRSLQRDRVDTFTIALKMMRGNLELSFSLNDDSSLTVSRASYTHDLWFRGSEDTLTLTPDMTSDDIASQLPKSIKQSASKEAMEFRDIAQGHLHRLAQTLTDDVSDESKREKILRTLEREMQKEYWTVTRQRCFLTTYFHYLGAPHNTIDLTDYPQCNFRAALKDAIHVPAFRRRHYRNYPTAEVGSSYPGTFEDYTASVVAKWEADKDSRLPQLVESLNALGLTSDVTTSRASDAEVDIRVANPGHANSTSSPHMVSLADVGIGVSYVLPVLVALQTAEPGQIVYVEQPESHLHPRAEYGLAEALMQAANRGVRVIAETHSSLLLVHIQTLIARGLLDSNKVGLHWFSLDKDGFTSIAFQEPDDRGRTGEWPEDFADTEMDANSAFLRSVRNSKT